MKTRNKIKQNIVRLMKDKQTGFLPNWVDENMENLIDRAIEILDKNNVVATDDNIYKVTYMAIDECF